MQGGYFGDFGGVEVLGGTPQRDDGLKDVDKCLRERAESKSHLGEDAQLGRRDYEIEKGAQWNAYRSEGSGRRKRFAEDNSIMPEGGHSDEDRGELPGRIEGNLRRDELHKSHSEFATNLNDIVPPLVEQLSVTNFEYTLLETALPSHNLYAYHQQLTL